jgi:hypothetical protein
MQAKGKPADCIRGSMSMSVALYNGPHSDTTLTVRTTQPRGWHSCFVLGRSWVQISARIQAMMTGFSCFFQSLQANSGTVQYPGLNCAFHLRHWLVG